MYKNLRLLRRYAFVLTATLMPLLVVCIGAYATLWQSDRSAVRDWKKEAYSSLVSQMYVLPKELIVGNAEQRSKTCKLRFTVSLRNGGKQNERSDDQQLVYEIEESKRFQALKSQLAKALLLADPPLRQQLEAYQDLLAQKPTITGFLMFDYVWGNNFKPTYSVGYGKIIVDNITWKPSRVASNCSAKNLARLREVDRAQERTITLMKEELGLH